MKIKTQTVVRTVCLIVALVNNILTVMGINPLPFSEEEIYGGVSALVTAVISLWAWWENNSFTKAAIAADEEYERIKAESSMNSEKGR